MTYKLSSLVYCIFLCLLLKNIQAQNLVMNPGFEERTEAFEEGNHQFKGVKDWRQPTAKNSVYLYEEGCENNKDCMGFTAAKSGNSCAGILLFSKTGNSIGGWSYVQGKLKDPLVRGKIYEVEFYLIHADSSPIVVNQVGVLFEKGTRKFSITARYPGNAQVKNTSENYFTENEKWMRFSSQFIAEGGERFITIGNFSHIDETPYHLVDKDFWERNNIINPNLLSAKYQLDAFYFIDDVSVTETPLTEENGRFSSIYFNSNSTIISESDLQRLEKLVKLRLSNIPDFKIRIEGFADKQGEEKDNTALSENRAKAVADYLIQHGVSPERVQIQGFGETQAAQQTSDNDRRVDVFLNLK